MVVEVRSLGILDSSMPVRVMVELAPGETLTLRQLLFERLAAEYDARLPAVLFDEAEVVRAGYAILIDGRNAMQLGGLDLVLRDGTSVLLTGMVSGG